MRALPQSPAARWGGSLAARPLGPRSLLAGNALLNQGSSSSGRIRSITSIFFPPLQIPAVGFFGNSSLRLNIAVYFQVMPLHGWSENVIKGNVCVCCLPSFTWGVCALWSACVYRFNLLNFTSDKRVSFGPDLQRVSLWLNVSSKGRHQLELCQPAQRQTAASLLELLVEACGQACKLGVWSTAFSRSFLCCFLPCMNLKYSFSSIEEAFPPCWEPRMALLPSPPL